MVITPTSHLAAFQLVYYRPVSAYIDCHLEFGAMYHVTTQDSPDTMAPHIMSGIGIGIGKIANDTDTYYFFMLHNNQIIAANTHTIISEMKES
jgi:hypothetical protein